MIDTVEVASFNVYRHLPRHEAIEDAVRLTGNEEIDVIGWQETRASCFPAVKRRLAGPRWPKVTPTAPFAFTHATAEAASPSGTGSLSGFHSDHRQLLATIRWYDR